MNQHKHIESGSVQKIILPLNPRSFPKSKNKLLGAVDVGNIKIKNHPSQACNSPSVFHTYTLLTWNCFQTEG